MNHIAFRLNPILQLELILFFFIFKLMIPAFSLASCCTLSEIGDTFPHLVAKLKQLQPGLVMPVSKFTQRGPYSLHPQAMHPH